MAFDAFIKIDQVPGESTDDKHKEWIEILSFHWGVSQAAAGTRSSAGGAGAERASFQDFSFVHVIDKASPLLFKHCAKGTHLKKIEFEACRAAGEKTVFQRFEFEDCIITSVHPGGASKDEMNLPLEEVSFNYGKMIHKHTPTDHGTGKALGAVEADWDLKANKASK
jgi:type VI secretion system secreted protein Hcp